MRHDRRRHRARAAKQRDLFGIPARRSTGWAPAWEAPPARARTELTKLMIHLLLEHARSRGAMAIEAARHEP
jgi:hypothetical protein